MNKNKVYFLGIGGIGMSALARYFHHNGDYVAGYDLTPSPLTAQLEAEGMEIHYKDDVNLIPTSVLENPEQTLVIYTPAIPADHKEWEYLRQKGFEIIKRSKALGHIAASHCCLAIAGTHGKTTTSTLLAHILTHSGKGCTAFLGGISKNYNSNLLLSHSDCIVAEADEFDRSFLQLFPKLALITAADADHLDIYGDHAHVKQAYVDFASQIENGALVLKYGVSLDLHLQKGTKLFRYALEKEDGQCDFYASKIKLLEGGCYSFDLQLQDVLLKDCILGIPGILNVENAVGASSIAFLYGIEPEEIRKALASFSGVKRRMDIQFKDTKHCYIDDYAHHPAELKAAITSARNMYPKRKLTGIFQPHLYTRTRDFAEEFAQSLSLLDTAILLPIYPAREEPIEGVDSAMILRQMELNDKRILDKEEVLAFIKTNKPEFLISLGAGNIDRLVPEITKIYSQDKE